MGHAPVARVESQRVASPAERAEVGILVAAAFSALYMVDVALIEP
jgi:hypothetical protein